MGLGGSRSETAAHAYKFEKLPTVFDVTSDDIHVRGELSSYKQNNILGSLEMGSTGEGPARLTAPPARGFSSPVVN
jgi:hypothetical protein